MRESVRVSVCVWMQWDSADSACFTIRKTRTPTLSLSLSLWSFVVVPVTVTVFVYSFDRLAFAFHSCSLILLSSTPVVSSSFFRSFRLLWSVSCAENEFVYVGCQPCGFVEATTVCLSSILICAYPFKCRPKPLCVDGDGEKNNLQSNERTNRQT